MNEEIEEQELLGILKLIAPGTPLRNAIEDIAKAKLGALIVISEPNDVLNLINGGFEVNCKFSPQKLVELCKMDGAVVIDGEIKKILYANALMVPDHNILTNETGTRHKAAERTAKQTNQLVIAVSERKGNVSIYKGHVKHSLRQTPDILQRAVETLRMIEKHKETFNELIANLNVLEFTNLTSLNDVIMVLQRVEMIARIEEIIRRHIIELGNEGYLVKIHLKEIRKGLDNEEFLILKDYSQKDAFTTKVALSELTLEEIIEPMNVINILGYQSSEDKVITKGIRILNKTSLSKTEIESLVTNFDGLQAILESSELSSYIDKSKTEVLSKELSKIREQVLLGKKI